ncbi:hypothetical protein U0070_004168, partial [Myodes glareolus]
MQNVSGGNESSEFVWVVRTLRLPRGRIQEPARSWRNSSGETAFQLMRAGTDSLVDDTSGSFQPSGEQNLALAFFNQDQASSGNSGTTDCQPLVNPASFYQIPALTRLMSHGTRGRPGKRIESITVQTTVAVPSDGRPLKLCLRLRPCHLGPGVEGNQVLYKLLIKVRTMSSSLNFSPGRDTCPDWRANVSGFCVLEQT